MILKKNLCAFENISFLGPLHVSLFIVFEKGGALSFRLFLTGKVIVLLGFESS